jgi:hypothetical protein
LFNQTPFLEKDSWVKKDKIKYPLGKIFFLKKANFFKIEKIEDKKEILNLILKQFWTNKDNFKMNYLIAKNFLWSCHRVKQLKGKFENRIRFSCHFWRRI